MLAVKLTDVDETGVLSVQVLGPGLSQLEELAKQIEEAYSAGEGGTVEPVAGGLYCTTYSMDDSWYRVKVLKVQSPHEVISTTYIVVYSSCMVHSCVCVGIHTVCGLW